MENSTRKEPTAEELCITKEEVDRLTNSINRSLIKTKLKMHIKGIKLRIYKVKARIREIKTRLKEFSKLKNLSKPTGQRIIAATLVAVILLSFNGLVDALFSTNVFDRIFSIVTSPIAMVPAIVLLVVVWKYQKFEDYKKHITLAVLYGAGAVLFVILCGLQMDVKFAKLINEHPPWIYIYAIAAVPALILTWYWKHMNNIFKQENDEQRLITERFAKATEMLGSENMAQRLGAIYQLERIADDSPRDHWTVMETLCAFVREQSPWTEEKQQWVDELKNMDNDERKKCIEAIKPATDLQAVMTVIGRRKYWKQEIEDQRLDFKGADLRCMNLQEKRFNKGVFSEAHLEGVFLSEASLVDVNFRATHLEGAHLYKAYLEGADLREAHLGGADLREAHLEGVDLSVAHLEGAVLREAHLKGAVLRGAHLEGADLIGAYLRDADLRRAHLEDADLYGANLASANLIGINLKGANIGTINLLKAAYDKSSIFPKNISRFSTKTFNPKAHGMIKVDEAPFGKPGDDAA